MTTAPFLVWSVVALPGLVGLVHLYHLGALGRRGRVVATPRQAAPAPSTDRAVVG